MTRICHTRFKGRAINGNVVNIPAKSMLGEQKMTVNGKESTLITWNGAAICVDRSQTYRDFFTHNDDGEGMLRGKLTRGIIDALKIRDGETREERDKRWEVIWDSPLCQKYKDEQTDNHWIWSIDFYNAPIIDLKQIAHLAGFDAGKIAK